MPWFFVCKVCLVLGADGLEIPCERGMTFIGTEYYLSTWTTKNHKSWIISCARRPTRRWPMRNNKYFWPRKVDGRSLTRSAHSYFQNQEISLKLFSNRIRTFVHLNDWVKVECYLLIENETHTVDAISAYKWGHRLTSRRGYIILNPRDQHCVL